MIWLVIWVVMMILWLVLGCYSGWEPDPAARRYNLGNTIIPWACVLILGLVLFGAVSTGTIVVEKPVQRIG